MEYQHFEDMGLRPELLQMIIEKGYQEPTPIQKMAIGPALEGNDIMGQAQTGTGKTAAFGIPILNKVTPGGGIQALIVCPTRELAVQVAGELIFLGKNRRIRTVPIYGGQNIELQLRSLERSPEVIVGTPGRLLDHLWRGTIILNGLDFLVLDEADEMLDMGFMPDIEKILVCCPAKRQSFLFSATIPNEVRDLSRRILADPVLIEIEPTEKTVNLVNQYYYLTSSWHKVEMMCRIIDFENPEISLIFSRTKKGAENLARLLNSRGYPSEALHGDMSQRERDSVMERFRQGHIKILVATDLAARGLDIDIISHVFNFDIPEDPDVYIHRIGRTARAGRGGTAITMVENSQIRILRTIERHINKQLDRGVLPSLKETIDKRKVLLIQRIQETAADDIVNYRGIAAEILKEMDPETALAAAIKLMAADEPDLESLEKDSMEGLQSMEGIETIHMELPVGRVHGMNPKGIVDYIARNTSVNARQVGEIEINKSSSFVEVPMANMDEISDAFAKFESVNRRNRNFAAGKRGRPKGAPPKRITT